MKPSPSLPRRCLAAIVMAAFSPVAAAAEPPAIVVDGDEKTIPSGFYKTTADSHVGLLVRNGGRATGNLVDISTTGANAYAVEITQATSSASLANGTLQTSGNSANGVNVFSGASLVLKDVRIVTEGGSAKGAQFNGAAAYGEFHASRIETSGYGATGIAANSAGRFSLEERTSVVTTGKAAKGVLVEGGSSMEATGAGIETSGDESHGLHVGSGSTATISGTAVITGGRAAHAVNADRASGLVTINPQSSFTTKGDHAIAINVQDGARLVVRKSRIETFGTEGHGVYDRAAPVSVQETEVTTHGPISYGVTAKGGDFAGKIPTVDVAKSHILTHGGSSFGAVASWGARLNLTDSFVTTTGANAHGLLANASVVETTNTVIETAGKNAHGIVVKDGGRLTLNGGSVRSAQSSALRLYDPSAVLIAGGAVLQGGNGVFAEVDPSSSNAFHIILENKAQAFGDIRLAPADSGKPRPDDATKLSLTIRDGAVWSGASAIVRDLSLEGGSLWHVTGDSLVRTLNNDHGIVAFAPIASGSFTTLTIAGDYVGNDGLFRMRSPLGDDNSPTDRIHVMGNTSGTSFIAIDALGGQGGATADGIQLVRVDGRSEGQFKLSGRAVAGAYEYFLHQGSISAPGDGGWYLRSSLSSPILQPEDGADPVDTVDPIAPPPVLRPEAGTYRANQTAALDMFQSGPGGGWDDEPESTRGSAWARFQRRHTAFDLGRQVTTTTSTNELTLGSDLLRSGGSVEGHVGVMAAVGQSDTRGTSILTRYSARGRVRGAAAGIYGGFRTAAGTYLRGWSQYAHFNQRVEGQALAHERYGSGALTTSVEAGHRWRRALNRDTDVYLEPQAQLVATRLRGGTHVEANGTRVAPRHASGSTSRLGLRAAARWQTPGGHVASPYVTGSWLRRLGRLDTTQFDDTSLAGGVPRNAYALKLGLSIVRNDGWRVWGDVESRFGVGRYRRMAGTVGLRKTW